MMMDNLRGTKLLSKISSDREAVVEEIIDVYGDKILRLCFIQLGNVEEAEDATQEVFLKVFKNIKKYNGDSSIYTWIYKITINTCFDILKKRNKLRYDDISLYINFIKDEKDTEMIILKNLTSKSIRVVLMKIPEKYRVLLYMFYFEELKISEISTILNEKENTIKTRLKRGKAALRRVIEKEEINYVQ